MITFDNITDEQIRELQRDLLSESNSSPEDILSADLANSSRYRVISPDGWQQARARCAEILNARAAQGRCEAITANTITDEQIAELIRTFPVEDRSIESAMYLLAAQGKSPGPAFRVPTHEEKMRAKQWCADILNARACAARELLS